MPFALVIDDNRQMADFLCEMLRLLGLNAQPAYGPRAAMLLINREAPQVVFLDLNMPGVDGFEVLAFLQREPQLAGIPVVVVTSDDQPETARRAKDRGARALIVKPVSLEALEETLRNLHLLKE